MTEDRDTPWTPAQRANLDALLDVLIPPGDSMPGAGALGVRSFLQARARDTEGVAEAVDAVLTKAAALLQERGEAGLDGLSVDERAALVGQVQADEPEAFRRFTVQAYLGYYTHPSIPPHFGMPDRPPHPQGHTLPEDEDLAELLAPVLQRGKRYLDC